ncbi:MAG: hypothetical protein WCX07_02130, partial [Dehalococcoidales bacterium]
AEEIANQASIKAEEALQKAQEALLRTLVKKVLSSKELTTIIVLAVLGSIFAAVTISLGLMLLG